MFGIMTGSIVNAALVIAGTALGLLFKAERLSRIGERVFEAFALFVLVLGVRGASDLSRPVFILVSLTLGVAVGELLDLDGAFARLGEGLQRRFSKGDDNRFSTGFLQATLLYCVGSMTVVGALQSGMNNVHDVLFAKGLIDGVTSLTLAMSLGPGVGFASLSVLLYEGALTLFAGALSPLLSPEVIALSSTIGSLSLVGMALNMLKVTHLKIANFLPAMFLPILWETIRQMV